MKPCVKFISLLSVGTLMGCAPFWTRPSAEPAPLAVRMPVELTPRVQALERISSADSPAENLVMLGRVAQDSGQMALAEERFVQALLLMPQHSAAQNALAVLYAQTDRVDQAIELFRRVLVQEPHASHVQHNLAYALRLAGRLPEVEAEIATAHELVPAGDASVSSQQQPTKALMRVEAGAQLVAVGRNVYELRDRLAMIATDHMAQIAAPASQDDRDRVLLSLHGIRLEVSNGVGIRFLARRTAERLASTGLVPARLTNLLKFQQPSTEIQFNTGQAEAAQALSAQFPFSVKTVASNGLLKHIQLRLVLGHDAAGKALLAWLEQSTNTRLASDWAQSWRWS